MTMRSMREATATGGSARWTRPFLAAVVALAACAAPPPAADAQTATAEAPSTITVPAAIDTASLMHDLRVLAADSMEGRAVATPGGARARTYILRRFREIGIEPIGPDYARPFSFGTRAGGPVNGVNVVGVIRGTSQPERYIVVSAHYDHEGIRDGQIYNGADDNASGTAALLAIAERVKRQPLAHSVIFAAFDAEESGLRGARAFVADPPVPLDRIVMDVNMDMVARGDTGELWASGTYHYPALRPVIEALAPSAPVTIRIGHDSPDLGPGQDWTASSDHGPFHAAGVPFIYFGVEDHPDYHKPTDDADRIDAGWYGKSVTTIMAALRAFDANPPARR